MGTMPAYKRTEITVETDRVTTIRRRRSIQVWCGPPEFLVGVDERYEALSAPGEFTSRAQYNKSIQDPAIRDMIAKAIASGRTTVPDCNGENFRPSCI